MQTTLSRRLLDAAAARRECAALLEEAAHEINGLTVLLLDTQARAENAERAVGVAVSPVESDAGCA